MTPIALQADAVPSWHSIDAAHDVAELAGLGGDLDRIGGRGVRIVGGRPRHPPAERQLSAASRDSQREDPEGREDHPCHAGKSTPRIDERPKDRGRLRPFSHGS